MRFVTLATTWGDVFVVLSLPIYSDMNDTHTPFQQSARKPSDRQWQARVVDGTGRVDNVTRRRMRESKTIITRFPLGSLSLSHVGQNSHGPRTRCFSRFWPRHRLRVFETNANQQFSNFMKWNGTIAVSGTAHTGNRMNERNENERKKIPETTNRQKTPYKVQRMSNFGRSSLVARR